MCKKKSFESLESASLRADEINYINKVTKKQDKLLRAYLCDRCGKYHLTSWAKKRYSKRVSKINSITKRREQSFIYREAQYYEKMYNL